MILDRVTITGADDSVSIDDLISITKDFPFVEWGILFSASQQGRPRFPTKAWLQGLVPNRKELRLSAHLCGHYVREAVSGEPAWWRDYPLIFPRFQRVQLNFHAQPHPANLPRMLKTIHHRGAADFIYQCDGVNDAWIRDLVKNHGGHPLFDTSGGAGELPKAWPQAWPKIYCGYAGGLGPDNIREQLVKIAQVTSMDDRIWVDMERRVRSEDDSKLDLNKVRTVLEQAQEFVITESV